MLIIMREDEVGVPYRIYFEGDDINGMFELRREQQQLLEWHITAEFYSWEYNQLEGACVEEELLRREKVNKNNTEYANALAMSETMTAEWTEREDDMDSFRRECELQK